MLRRYSFVQQASRRCIMLEIASHILSSSATSLQEAILEDSEDFMKRLAVRFRALRVSIHK